MKIVLIIIVILLILFLALITTLFLIRLFATSRDDYGFVNECIGCPVLFDDYRDCGDCKYRPELWEWDEELQMEVRKKRKRNKK